MRIPIKTFLPALVLPFALSATDLKIDHVTVAGEHLDAMRKALTAVAGLPTEYGGPHSNHATEMALVSFRGRLLFRVDGHSGESRSGRGCRARLEQVSAE
jgi:hypothetical protein